jgi:uncharacterized RDD family membrane protein YckC
MSAPLSGSSGGNPAPGFYPDPSIPGYIRYWNGTSWVPGTSRPEPEEGEPLPTPPSAAASSSAVAPPTREEPAPAEETGPVFLDEEPGVGAASTQAPQTHVPEAYGQEPQEPQEPQVPAAREGDSPLPEVRRRGEVAQAGSIDWDDPSRLHGQRPEPASAWQADAAQQTGFTGQHEERVSWGRGEDAPEGAGDPRGGWGRTGDEGLTEGRTDGGTASPAAPGASPETGTSGAPADSAGTPPRDGTFQMRAMSSEALRRAAQEAGDASGAASGSPQPEHTVGLRRSEVAEYGQSQSPTPSNSPSPSGTSAPATPSAPSAPQPSAPQSPAPQSSAPQSASVPHQAPPAQPQAPVQQPPAQAPPGVPQQGAAPGPGHAQPSWAQQVHDLAGGAPGAHGAPGTQGSHGAQGPGLDAQGAAGPESVMPWRPPVADPFLQAAQQEARPASLGKRFAARLVDGVLTGAVVGAVAFPFLGQAVDHVEAKIEAVRDAGETRTVWLIDGTTGGCLAVVLGVLVVFGLLYEVLPTSRWGRTLGKKLFGLRVLTMEQHDKPGFGSALKRWLTYGVLSALVVGVVNVLWCVFDRPWRQCWHDKLAGTFVSKDSGEIRL